MSLVVLFGPQASGKMTVGQYLTDITEYKLFFNHMAIDFVGSIFKPERLGKMWEFDYTYWNLVSKIYDDVIKFSMYNNIDLVYTLVWDFTNQNIMEYMQGLEKIFNKYKKKIYFVELECDVKERLRRNKTEDRLKSKPPKRDIKASEYSLLNEYKEFRLNSLEGEMQFKNYIKINNTHLSPSEVALTIKNRFKL